MAKKVAWPKIKFREKGPKVPAGGFGYLGFGWELHYYDFLHRWNGGVPEPDCFQIKGLDNGPAVARVKYFHGIYDDRLDKRDLRLAVYNTWNDLPRGSLPIATVDIEGGDWDLCTLLTFTWTDRCNKIYLLANPHECGPDDPDDLSELQLVASSLPQFMKQLQPSSYFYYRTWFQLPVPVSELRAVGERLVENGVQDWNGAFSNIESTGAGRAYNSKPGFAVWLASPNSSLDGAKAPAKVSKECSILAIDAHRWNHDDAIKHVRKILKKSKLDNGLKTLGVTSAEFSRTEVACFDDDDDDD